MVICYLAQILPRVCPGQDTGLKNQDPLFSDPFRRVDFKYSQGVNGSFTLHSVSGLVLEALPSFALLCFSDTIEANGILLGIKTRT